MLGLLFSHWFCAAAWADIAITRVPPASLQTTSTDLQSATSPNPLQNPFANAATTTSAPASALPVIKEGIIPLTVSTLDIREQTGTLKTESQSVPLEKRFKKKILTTAFSVSKLGQVEDLDDIAQNFPREILRRLENSGRFLVRHIPNLLSYSMQQEVPTAAMLKQVSAVNDSQFVISGEIRNAGNSIQKKFFGLWNTPKRHIEIEFYIYDGISGQQIARHVLSQETESPDPVGRNLPFASSAFFATNYGEQINQLLDEAVTLVQQDLQPFPMLARILKISNGQIYLDAGATSLISVGDMASVVSYSRDLSLFGMTPYQQVPQNYGMAQTTVGSILIVQIQYPFAIGEMSLELKAGKVNVGDYISFADIIPKVSAAPSALIKWQTR